MNRPGLKWLWIAILVFIADISSKFYIIHTMPLGWEGRIEVMPFFNLLYARNYGAAFSFLSDEGGWQRWFFTGLAILITTLLLYWAALLKSNQKMLAIAYSLVIGGAMGNLFDRLYHGFVVDFIDIYYKNSHWPTFNLADSAIVLGVILIFLESLLTPSESS